MRRIQTRMIKISADYCSVSRLSSVLVRFEKALLSHPLQRSKQGRTYRCRFSSIPATMIESSAIVDQDTPRIPVHAAVEWQAVARAALIYLRLYGVGALPQ
jgi:hypothetical protein